MPLIDQYEPASTEVTESANCFHAFMPANITLAITGLAKAGGSESLDNQIGTVLSTGFFMINHSFSEKCLKVVRMK